MPFKYIMISIAGLMATFLLSFQGEARPLTGCNDATSFGHTENSATYWTPSNCYAVRQEVSDRLEEWKADVKKGSTCTGDIVFTSTYMPNMSSCVRRPSDRAFIQRVTSTAACVCQGQKTTPKAKTAFNLPYESFGSSEEACEYAARGLEERPENSAYLSATLFACKAGQEERIETTATDLESDEKLMCASQVEAASAAVRRERPTEADKALIEACMAAR